MSGSLSDSVSTGTDATTTLSERDRRSPPSCPSGGAAVTLALLMYPVVPW